MVLGIAFNTLSAKAETNKNSFVVINYEDGFIVETIIKEDFSVARANQKSGTKTVNYYNGNTLLWSISVYRTFSYTGSSVSITSATVSAYSNNSNWKISKQST